jgi:hypothetical protein
MLPVGERKPSCAKAVDKPDDAPRTNATAAANNAFKTSSP